MCQLLGVSLPPPNSSCSIPRVRLTLIFYSNLFFKRGNQIPLFFSVLKENNLDEASGSLSFVDHEFSRHKRSAQISPSGFLI